MLFNSDIVNFVWKTDEEGKGVAGYKIKHFFVNFCSLTVL